MAIAISTIEQLQLIGNDINYPLSEDYELANDIDASSTLTWNNGLGFKPIGSTLTPFIGTLSGGSSKFKISNLYISRYDEDQSGVDYHIGIISNANNATFSNLSIDNANITGYSGVAILFAYGDTVTINNCSISGTLSGYKAGAFSGEATNCAFNNCDSDVSIFSGVEVGGLVATSFDSNYVRCSTNVQLECESDAGGLIGTSRNSNAFDCHSSGTIVVNANNSFGYIGGLFGRLLSDSPTSYIDNCSSSCNIDCTLYNTPNLGGFAGYTSSSSSASSDVINCHATGNIQSNSDYVGGFIGQCHCRVERCCSTGNISGNNIVGGFLGFFTPTGNYRNVINSYSSGNVYGIDYVGGFIGVTPFQGYNVEIRYSYSNGLVTSSGNVGGFCAFSQVTIEDCYWDIDTSNQSDSSGGVGKSTYEMKIQTTFANWDFDALWKIEENVTYPCFLLANFSADVESGSAPLTVTFVNETSGWPSEDAQVITYDWDFGDGTAHSTIKNPIHVYQDSGVYSVVLIENRNNIEVTKTKVNFITIIDNVYITYQGNGNTGGTAPVDINNPYQRNETISVLPHGDLTKDTFFFYCWNTQPDGSGTDYFEYSSIVMSQDVVLYAKWISLGPTYWDIETSGISVSVEGFGKTTSEMTVKGTPNVFENWDFDTTWFMNEPEL